MIVVKIIFIPIQNTHKNMNIFSAFYRKDLTFYTPVIAYKCIHFTTGGKNEQVKGKNE